MSDRFNVALFIRNSIYREGLSRILTELEFDIVEACDHNWEILVEGVGGGDQIPQLILIDSRTEWADNFIAELQVRFPRSSLVMLSDRFDFQMMRRAFGVGMRAYIVEDISCGGLAETLRLVLMGERVFPSQLAYELQSRPAFMKTHKVERSFESVQLSQRELELLRWLTMGYANKVISRHMEICDATVKVHVKAIFRKLQVNNRTQAAIWAINHGIHELGHD